MQPLHNKQQSLLLFTLSGLIVISLISIFVATRELAGYPYVKRQVIWILAGTALLLLLQRQDYRLLVRKAYWFYGVGLLFLISVYVLGKKVNGAVSWIDLGIFRMQPSELTRLTTLLLLAKVYEACKGECTTTRQILLCSVILAIPTAAVLLQPDLGMAIIYVSLCGCFILLTRFSGELIRLWLIVLGVVILIGTTVTLLWPHLLDQLLRPHQLERLTSFLHPEFDPLGSGYQYIQARSVVGSGELGGTGLLWVITANGGKLPEQHTDFIFAVIAQQWGFIGASLLLLLYFVLFYILVQWAMGTPDLFASFFISGMVTMWFFQVFVNIGMNIGLSPITGLTLPFISYGGSSFITNMIGMGLVLSMKTPPPLWELE